MAVGWNDIRGSGLTESPGHGQESRMEDRSRVALVTGAGGGLGEAVAELLAARGVSLALVDIRPEQLTEVAQRIEERGAAVHAMEADLADADSCAAVVAETIERLGRVDILVNAAAILARREWDEVTAESFDHVFRINARAPFFLARAAFTDMEQRRWGRVVNITSTGVYEGGFTMTSAVYEASKGAVAVMTKMLAAHGADKGILVNTVCPGGMRTRMLLEQTSPELLQRAEEEIIPLRRLADPIEVARMVVWLAGDENTYATGAEFDITGGVAIH